VDPTLLTAGTVLARALIPLTRALAGTNESLVAHFEKLGWILTEVPKVLKDLQSAGTQVTGCLARLEQGLRQVGEGSRSESDLEQPATELLLALALLAAAIRELPAGLRSQLPPAFVTATHIDEKVQKRLYDDALSRLLEYDSKEAYLIARLLGFVESIPRDADPARFQPAFEERIIRLDRLLAISDGPAALMRDVYGWGTPVLDSAKLFMALRDLSVIVLSPCFFDYASRSLLRAIVPALPDDALRERGLLVRLFQGTPLELSLGVYPLPKKQPDELEGLVAILTGLASIQQLFQLAPSVSLKIDSQIDLASGIALAVWPDRPPKILGNVATAAQLIQSGSTKVGLSYAPTDENDRLRLLSFTDFNLDSQGLSLDAGVKVGTDSSIDAFAEVGLTKLRVQLGGLGQDSFLAEVMPESVTVEFDLIGGWSSIKGLYWRGKAGPAISVPIIRRIGPAELHKLDISFASHDGTFQVALGVSGSCLIGPVVVEVDGLGVAIAADTHGGNLGPIDLALSAVHPGGVGLAIDAAGVSGGGFLFLDQQSGLYTGALQLNLEGGLALRALGLIATRLPDGSKGFSLLVVITAEDFKPYPLGLGFWLTGIGGLLAINRTFNEQVLREGIKNHTLDSVLFPENPTRDALQLLSNLNKVFPIAPGHHLLGPMAEIEWGTPTLFTMQLGIVLEIGARLRLLVMGQVEAILPKKENDLLRIKMDAVGILDFDQGTASLDAVLYESRLLRKFVLTGAMALRLKWKGAPNFALAIGGLHHAFSPPANFPRLDRIAINLSAGDNPRIICEAYFAVTSNTVQFGARANLYAAAHGFSIEGDIGFDVLIQLNPFHFLAEFHASVQLKCGSHNLFMVAVQGALEGPRPLRARGKATFEILWCDISVSFDKTLVEGDRPPLPPTINVLNELAQALADPRNWQEALPTGERRVVTVREMQTPNEVRIHPLGKIGVKQTVVPLNLTRDIDKFGGTTPSGPRRFSITSITIGGMAQKPTPQTDFFAPAQFFEMTDDEKIASPSFDTMEAGIMVGVDDFVFNMADGKGVVLTYKTILVDTQTSAPGTRKEDYTLRRDRLFEHARFGAAGRSDVRRSGTTKFQNRERKPAVAVTKPGFVIASTEDLSPQAVPGAEAGKPINFIDAQQVLRNLSRQSPAEAKKRQVVRAYELIRS
jgi:hypothetical protein